MEFKRQDFFKLTKLLSEYWNTEDDLSSALAISDISFQIEETIIELAKQYELHYNFNF